MRLLRGHGITRTQNEMINPVSDKWYYEQKHLGYNYRMCDIQAALGLSQLDRLDGFVEERNSHAVKYAELISHLPLIPQVISKQSNSARHLYVVRLDEKECQHSRDAIFRKLHEIGILVNVHYIPIHTQPYFRQFGFKWGDFVNAEKYFQQALSLPMYPDLHLDQIQYVCSGLEQILHGQ